MIELKEPEPPGSLPIEINRDPEPELVMPASWQAGRDSKSSQKYEIRDQEGLPEISLPDAEEDGNLTIETLRKMLAEREDALMHSELVASDLQHDLEESKTAATALQRQLVSTVRAAQAAGPKAAAPGSDEMARMQEQFRRAQKALEREFARVRDELVRTKGQEHRVRQQLDAEARARRVEAAHASAKISALQRQMEDVARASFAETASRDKERTRARFWLGLGSAAALVMFAAGMWSQYPGLKGQTSKQEATPPIAMEASPACYSNDAPASGGSEPTVSQASFQRSLSRLNDVLSGPLGKTPEQILIEVRNSRHGVDPKVCDFAWNGGQPALRYGIAGGSMDASLSQCAAAVEKYIAKK